VMKLGDPRTTLHVQRFVANEITEKTNTYEPVTCIMCRQLHYVNPFTGKILGDDSGPGRSEGR
jgi:hypothetical protein